MRPYLKINKPKPTWKSLRMQKAKGQTLGPTNKMKKAPGERWTTFSAFPGNHTKNLEVQIWTLFYIRANRIQAQGLTSTQQRSLIIWRTEDTGNKILYDITAWTRNPLYNYNKPPPSLVQVKRNCGKYHTSYLLTLTSPLKNINFLGVHVAWVWPVNVIHSGSAVPTQW